MRTLTQAAARQYDTARVPKWWHPEMMRTFLFLQAYLDRNDEIIPPELQKDLQETLRLLPIMCEEFVKAACVPRNRFRRVRPPHRYRAPCMHASPPHRPRPAGGLQGTQAPTQPTSPLHLHRCIRNPRPRLACRVGRCARTPRPRAAGSKPQQYGQQWQRQVVLS